MEDRNKNTEKEGKQLQLIRDIFIFILLRISQHGRRESSKVSNPG